MKRLWFAFIWLLAAPVWAAPSGVTARAWVVVDAATGRELAAYQADLPMPPASLTQLMTAYVLLGDVRDKKLALDTPIPVPEAATRADGARVFLKSGETVPAGALLQAMLLHSASDATLALVTAVSGDEAAFVERMNKAAARLGMTRTHFLNATGLHEQGHESSARDLAVLGRALIRTFPAHASLFKQRELVVNGVTYYNSNRLLWRDPTVNGLKVGRTPEAGYCMAALAQRGGQQRIAVVLGTRSDAQRTQDALRLLNYGFEQFDSVPLYRAQQPVKAIEVYRGARSSVSMGFTEDFHLLTPKGSAARVKGEVITQQPIIAPVRKGQHIGTLRLSLDGKPLGDYPLVALHDVSVAGIFGRGWDTLRLFFGR